MHDVTRDALDARLLAWTRGAQGADTFEALALDVFRYQYAHNTAYRRWCDRHDAMPDTVTDWRRIPAVPQVAFKEWTLTTFDVRRAVARFDSSGTTAGRPSRHYFDTMGLYERAIVPTFKHFVLPDAVTLPCLALVPSWEQAPHASLTYMASVVARACCDGAITYFVRDGAVDTEGFLRACRSAEGPVLVFTTGFGLVHVLDALEAQNATIALPAGSRIMETGGYKGRTRNVPKSDLYAWAAARLGVREDHIINEYGMCELSSQWYDTTLADAVAGRAPGARRKAGPPWSRAVVLDPRSGTEAAPGAVGLIRVYDPMNRGSVACIQTEDLGRRIDGGFEVLGRATDAELRGCSLELDTF